MVYAWGVMLLWAQIPPIVIGSAMTALVALVACIVGFVGLRRTARESARAVAATADVSFHVALIHESQDALRVDNVRLREDNAGLRSELARSGAAAAAEIVGLRDELVAARVEVIGLREQVSSMQIELATVLGQHSDCEEIKATLEAVIADLKRQGGMT